MHERRVILGADPLGFELKNAVRDHLVKRGCLVTDITADAPLDYEAVGDRVGKAISTGSYEFGFVFCGTGMGVNIVANKHPGVYCGLCESVETARLCRIINNCNVLAIGGLLTGAYRAQEMVDAFLNAQFAEGFTEATPAFLKDAFERVQLVERSIYQTSPHESV